MSNCTNCESSIAEGAKFCPSCGQPTAEEILLCSQCGTRNEVLAKFCVACGSSLEDTSFAITEIPSLEEELAPTTELFAEADDSVDAAGSTSSEEDLVSEPEHKEQKASRLAKAKALIENLANRAPQQISEPELQQELEPKLETEHEPLRIVQLPASLYDLNITILTELMDELVLLKNDTDDIEYIQFTCDRINTRDVPAYSPFRLPEKPYV